MNISKKILLDYCRWELVFHDRTLVSAAPAEGLAAQTRLRKVESSRILLSWGAIIALHARFVHSKLRKQNNSNLELL